MPHLVARVSTCSTAVELEESCAHVASTIREACAAVEPVLEMSASEAPTQLRLIEKGCRIRLRGCALRHSGHGQHLAMDHVVADDFCVRVYFTVQCLWSAAVRERGRHVPCATAA